MKAPARPPLPPLPPCEDCGIPYEMRFTRAHRRHCELPAARRARREERARERDARAYFTRDTYDDQRGPR